MAGIRNRQKIDLGIVLVINLILLFVFLQHIL